MPGAFQDLYMDYTHLLLTTALVLTHVTDEETEAERRAELKVTQPVGG